MGLRPALILIFIIVNVCQAQLPRPRFGNGQEAYQHQGNQRHLLRHAQRPNFRSGKVISRLFREPPRSKYPLKAVPDPSRPKQWQDNRWDPIKKQKLALSKKRFLSKPPQKPVKPVKGRFFKKEVYGRRRPGPTATTLLRSSGAPQRHLASPPTDISRIDVVTPRPGPFESLPFHARPSQASLNQIPGSTKQLKPFQPSHGPINSAGTHGVHSHGPPDHAVPVQPLVPDEEVNGIKIYKFKGSDGLGSYDLHQNHRAGNSAGNIQLINQSAPSSATIAWSQALINDGTSFTPVSGHHLSNIRPTAPPTPPPPFPTVHTTPSTFQERLPVVIIAQSNVVQN